MEKKKQIKNRKKLNEFSINFQLYFDENSLKKINAAKEKESNERSEISEQEKTFSEQIEKAQKEFEEVTNIVL